MIKCLIYCLLIIACASCIEKSTDGDVSVIQTNSEEFFEVDSSGAGVVKYYKDENRNLIKQVREEQQVTESKYYDHLGKLVLITFEKDDSLKYIFPDKFYGINESEMSSRAGNYIYEEYLFPTYRLKNSSNELDLCDFIFANDSIGLRNEIATFFEKNCKFILSKNEMNNLIFYISLDCKK